MILRQEVSVRLPLLLATLVSLSASTQAHALEIITSYKINEWVVDCWGDRGDQVACLMAKQVAGVGNFRIEWYAEKVTLGELTCQTPNGWKYTDFQRRGQTRQSVTLAIHNRVQEAVLACNGGAWGEVDDTHDVASLLARVTD